MRTSQLTRQTKETSIQCCMKLDGTGQCQIDTGIGFFNHMLELFAFHSRIDLELSAVGDLAVCDHHTIEDCGIILGECLKNALGDKRGIARYGFMSLPMDEALANVTLDLSGRSYLVYNCELKRENIGAFSVEMLEEFLRAFSFNAGMTLHVNVPYGTNDHHKIEAVFKGLGRALKQAVRIEGDELPSTKGMLQ